MDSFQKLVGVYIKAPSFRSNMNVKNCSLLSPLINNSAQRAAPVLFKMHLHGPRVMEITPDVAAWVIVPRIQAAVSFQSEPFSLP